MSRPRFNADKASGVHFVVAGNYREHASGRVRGLKYFSSAGALVEFRRHGANIAANYARLVIIVLRFSGSAHAIVRLRLEV